MKIGICTNWQDKERLDAIAQAGAEYVEFCLNSFEEANHEQVRECADYLKKIGLKVQSFNGMFPWRGLRLTGEEVASDERIAEYLEKVLSATDVFEAPYVVFGSSGARKMLEGDQRGKAQAQLFHLMEDLIVPAFEKHDRIMVIEPLNAKEDNLVNTVADAMMYVNIIKNPRVRALADFYHAGILMEDVTSYARYKNDLLHCHVAGVKSGRHAPLPNDGDDAFYTLCFRTLEKMGYEGVVSVEGSWGDDFTEEVKASVAYLKSIR